MIRNVLIAAMLLILASPAVSLAESKGLMRITFHEKDSKRAKEKKAEIAKKEDVYQTKDGFKLKVKKSETTATRPRQLGQLR